MHRHGDDAGPAAAAVALHEVPRVMAGQALLAPEEAALFEIRESTIPGAGLGVFARTAWVKGALMGHYEGENLTQAEFTARYPHGASGYVYRVHANLSIDARDPALSNFARYINSPAKTSSPRRSANTKFGNKAELRAKTNIRVGDELLIGYGDSYGEPPRGLGCESLRESPAG